MKANKLLYTKGFSLKARKDIKMTLLSTKYSILTVDNYKKYLRRKISETVFSMRETKDGTGLESIGYIKIPLTFMNKFRIARSAVLEFSNGIVLIISVGPNTFNYDLGLSNYRLFKDSELYISDFKILYGT